jgi:hypothetical protein
LEQELDALEGNYSSIVKLVGFLGDTISNLLQLLIKLINADLFQEIYVFLWSFAFYLRLGVFGGKFSTCATN